MVIPVVSTGALPAEPLVMNSSASFLVNHQIITYKLLRAIGESLEPEDVAYLAVEKVAELTGWPTVALLAPNAQGMMVVRAAMGDMLTDVGMNGRAFRTGDAQHVNDLIGDSDEGPTYQKLYSALSIPMTRGRRRLGVFNVEKDEPFSQNDILLAESMAEVIALALDNAELYAQAQRQLAAQTALQEAVSTISSSLELPVVLNRIAEQMCRAGRATSAYICSYEKQTGMSIVLAEYISPAASAAEQESDLGITYFVPKEFPADMTLLERGYLAIRHVDDPDLPPEEQAHMLQYGAQTVLTIPLQIGGETVAYAEIWESRRRRVFTEGEMELCRGIAQHAAVAMENARLFQAMREEHGRFQALMQSDDDGIILVGMGGHILFMNMPGFTFLRLEVASETGPETWIGRPIDDLVALMQSYAAPAAAVMAAESDRIIIGNEAGGEGEVEIPPRMIHWRNLPVVTDGQPIGRLIILRDVTQEHALEKMRDDLTHTMVHDLRGPLTSISLSLEVLQMLEQLPQDTAERRSQAIERAYNSTQKLLELVEAILELSRLESGRLLLNYQPIILADMVATVLDVQLPLSREKEIELVCHVPDSLPPLSADRSLLERVLQNLVDNALKFTPVGGRVCIKVQSDTAEPQTICVAVSDTGRGIPPEMQSNLFQKFSRGMQKERGSGLGLYFCKMVVEAHDGRIWLAHSDERGTSIHFTLPVNSEQ